MPIIAYDVGEIRQLACAAGSILIPTGDEAALAAALISVLSSRSDRLHALSTAAQAAAATLHAELAHTPSVDAAVSAFEHQLRLARQRTLRVRRERDWTAHVRYVRPAALGALAANLGLLLGLPIPSEASEIDRAMGRVGVGEGASEPLSFQALVCSVAPAALAFGVPVLVCAGVRLPGRLTCCLPRQRGWVCGLGIATLVLATALSCAATVTLRQCLAAARAPLCMHGPFHLSRNPICVAIVLLSGAFALLLPTVPSVLGVGSLARHLHRKLVDVEEDSLGLRHHTAWPVYTLSTPRWVAASHAVGLGVALLSALVADRRRAGGERTPQIPMAAADEAAADTGEGSDHEIEMVAAAKDTAAVEVGLRARLLLLLLLYALQGALFGFIGGALPVLMSHAPFSALGLLSLSLAPFSLKAAMAPLIDSCWVASVGRRKSWVVPCTAIAGAMLALLATAVDGWVASGALVPLSCVLGSLVLIMSAQDVAVDAWAVELLPLPHLSYAAVCQTVGMSAGNILGHPLLLALTSGATPRTVGAGGLGGMDGLASRYGTSGTMGTIGAPDAFGAASSAGDRAPQPLAFFCSCVAAAHLVIAMSAALMPEPSGPRCEGERPMRLHETLQRLASLATLESTRSLGVVCFWQRLAAVSIDATAAVYYMRLPGAEQAHLASFALAQAPLGLLASVLVARRISAHQTDTASAMRLGFFLLLVSGVLTPLILGSGMLDASSPAAAAVLFFPMVLYAVGNKVWWTAQATAFNSVVVSEGSVATRALHLQLLNSLSNLGKLWPRPVSFTLMHLLGFLCASMGMALAGGLAWPSMRKALASPALEQSIGARSRAKM